ncbi:hypothetical protein BDV95DRAFT_294181 [Massariosphaeria phaeospora]|uniref:Uncharacterized protein n=1 Tax=Massariosphaeria phaeospora TaxID=100035 RepID=A0A7C8HY92_9PLEO|nr:hypothetical protein BDV95DRAFT_294181 [Massariosphaeria phaeospora]
MARERAVIPRRRINEYSSGAHPGSASVLQISNSGGCAGGAGLRSRHRCVECGIYVIARSLGQL